MHLCFNECAIGQLKHYSSYLKIILYVYIRKVIFNSNRKGII